MSKNDKNIDAYSKALLDKKTEYNDELIKTIKEELKTDDQGAKCYGLTKLGLVEISRKRISKTLKEQLWI